MKHIRRLIVFLLIVLFIYSLGFLFITPIMLNSPESLKPLSFGVLDLLYNKPMSMLDEDYFIYNVWIDLNTYWCEADVDCEVVKE